MIAGWLRSIAHSPDDRWFVLAEKTDLFAAQANIHLRSGVFLRKIFSAKVHNFDKLQHRKRK